MRQVFLFLLTFFLGLQCFSQIGENPKTLSGPGDLAEQQGEEVEKTKPLITDYKIITVKSDTTVVDTSLTIIDDYRFNYLRQDNFELLPFSNVGQTYNKLAHDFREQARTALPQFGARARHYNFMEVEDIFYFHVPTPLTELYYKSVFEQGQTLDALFTVNTSPNLNLSMAYKGNRSLGKYQHILTSTGNFRTTLTYQTPNKKYRLKTHFVSQDLMNEENGGLQPFAVAEYLSENEEFLDRSRLDVNFRDAQSTLYGKRFFLDHSYDLVKLGDSITTNRISLGHISNFTYKKFQYEQETASDFLGPSFEEVNINDEVRLETFRNEAYVAFFNQYLGTIKARAAYTKLDYGYNSRLLLEDGTIPEKIRGEVLSAGGAYSKKLGRFDFYAQGMLNLSSEFEGMQYETGASFSFWGNNSASAALHGNSRAPNYNFLLYQSDYINYNWYNDFSNVVTHTLQARLEFPRLLNIDAAYTNVHNYSYFGLDTEGLVKPMQAAVELNYFRIKGQREISVGRFALDNTVLYQKVLDGASFRNVPDFITRNSLYYRDHWFKRALYLQTGFTFKYFTNYNMDGYDPVLAEFYVQNALEMEGFPQVDFFFNGKIKQARIFFKLEHLNSLVTGNTYFSAPLYPYRDFGVRFGLVWNFFM